MLRSMRAMEDYSIEATDGIAGRVTDFYFDDDTWVIRYLIVALAGGVPPGGAPSGDAPLRKVLISPIAIGAPNWSAKLLPVAATQSQIRGSPAIDTDKPVSRQQEMGYLGYYGYGAYWGGGGLWGAGMYPDVLQAGLQAQQSAEIVSGHQDDPHLRSGNTVMRYYVHASDGDIGHVQGFLVDEKTWSIQYLIVNTSNWWLGNEVLLSPAWIADVSWTESIVSIDLTRQAIKDAPVYDSNVPLDREREALIHEHYRRTDRRPHGESKLGAG